MRFKQRERTKVIQITVVVLFMLTWMLISLWGILQVNKEPKIISVSMPSTIEVREFNANTHVYDSHRYIVHTKQIGDDVSYIIEHDSMCKCKQ